jgi:hypothetical protein
MSINKDTQAVVSAERFKYESSQELDDLDEDGVISMTVPPKYRGTATDKSDMHTLGKVQVLRVSLDTACPMGIRFTDALFYPSATSDS